MLTKKRGVIALTILGTLILAGSAFGDVRARGSQQAAIFQGALIGENGRVDVVQRNPTGYVAATPIEIPKPPKDRLGRLPGSVAATPIEIPRPPKDRLGRMRGSVKATPIEIP